MQPMTPMTNEQAMGIAVGHHQAGRLAEAEALYRQVLSRSPDHAEALHLLGVLASQAGRTEVALELIGRAIAVNPAVALYHSNLGEIYRRSGHSERAIDHLHRAIELRPDAADPHNNLGNVLREQGRRDEALALYRRAITLNPDHADAHNNLGVVLKELGRLDDALAAYHRAIALRPGYAEGHSNLGDALKELGRLEEALAAYRQAIALKPDLAQTHNNLGCALKDHGRLEEAIAAFERAIVLNPGYAAAHSNLGCALKDEHRLEEAIAAHRRAIELQPDLADAHNNLGNALKDQGRLEEAIAAFRRAIALSPGYATAYSNLGNSLKDQGRYEEAIAAHRRAIALRPDLVDSHNNLACALKDGGRLEEAIAVFHQAIRLSPAHAAAHNNLGNALKDQGRLEEVVDAYQRALQLSPGYATAHSNLGMVLSEQGRIDEALACFRRAVELKPDFTKAGSNYLLTLHYHPGYDAQALLAEHRQWAQRFAEPLAAEIAPYGNDRAPDRKLRIGYVSPDFRDHPVGHLVLPLFANHDRQQIEIVGYADVRKPDALTAKFKALASEWCVSGCLSDRQLAERIRGDRIDILVDLALHTAGNRMLVFARKPAPVQVSMLGMPTTTGLATIDYRLTDPYFDPPGAADAAYTEQSIRLPHSIWCYEPHAEAPVVGPLPAVSNGLVTFGCLNHFAKVSRPTLETWTRILQALPGARLVLQAVPGSYLDPVRGRLQDAGIAPDRVQFLPKVPRHEYLRRYHQLDISLDPFPYNGHTSTLDAVWMGVPVIALAGRTGVGRAGVSVLSNLELPELIAKTPEQYVAIAVALAGDHPRLAALRAALRPKMQASPLVDGKQYAADIETAFRRIWKTWCRS